MSVNKPYTMSKNAAVDSLLDGVLKSLSGQIAKSPCADKLDFLVLGGGYGRGEGGVFVDAANVAHLYNDLDFFVISKTSSASDAKVLGEYFSKVSAELGGKLGIDVDFNEPRTLWYIRKRTNMMMWREMASSCRVVYGGEERFAEAFKNIGRNQLPWREFLKLMLNRFTGLMLATELIYKYPAGSALPLDDANFVMRNINKALLACADVALRLRGKYASETAVKKELFKSVCLPAELSETAPAFARAVEFKARPYAELSRDILFAELVKAKKLAVAVLDYSLKNGPAEPLCLVDILRDFNRGRKVGKVFAALGAKHGLFSNPTKSALTILENFLKSDSMPDKNIFSLFKTLWNCVN